MKALLLIPSCYSLQKTIQKGFEKNGFETIAVDYESFFSHRVNQFVRTLESLPNKIKSLWKDRYVQKVNAGYIRLFESMDPDVVFIYNNQLILPETLARFKTRSKIIFFLGDNPLYTPTSDYNLVILYHADYIISPDSFWISQLERMGIRNLHFGVFGYDEETFYPFEPKKEELEKYQCDLVFVGAAQKNNWGYKRFLFLNHFRRLNIKAYISGDGFHSKWKAFFPNLDKNIIPHKLFDSRFNNLVCNCSKIYPIDLVPSLFHGIHIRIMDCIGSGIMPLVEYSGDLQLVFKDCFIPAIRNYNEAERTAIFYLKNDSRREAVVAGLRNYVQEKYTARQVVGSVLEKMYD